MRRFLSVLIASMFLASAAIAAEKMGDEKKAPAAKEGETTSEKKAVKGDKAAKSEKAAKGESETKGEGKTTKGEGKKSDTK